MVFAAGALGRSSTAASPLDDGGPNFDFSGEGTFTGLGNQRWRELFPLPQAPVPCTVPGSSVSSKRRRVKVRDRVLEANSIVGCMNEMHGSSHAGSVLHPTQAQHLSQHKIYEQLGRMKKPNTTCTACEAAQELLHFDVSYDGSTDLSTVRPYDRDRVSLPDVGATLV